MPPRTRTPLSGFIAPILTRALEDAELTQTQLGRKADISQSAVSKYLRGVRVPDIDTLEDICTALGLDVSDVIAEAKRDREIR